MKERDGLGGQEFFFFFLKEWETWFGLQTKQKEPVGREEGKDWLDKISEKLEGGHTSVDTYNVIRLKKEFWIKSNEALL